jgi:hypothetical protein
MPSTVVKETKVVHLDNTVSTRTYPFTQETLDELQDIRSAKEEEHFRQTGEHVIYPAPVIMAEAIHELHQDYFLQTNAEKE